MTTQREYGYSVAGFLVLVLLVTLGAGCCGTSGSTDRKAFENCPANPGLVGTAVVA